MELAIGGVFFVAAALAVAAMGFAIQRGATCTVAAVDELLTQRRASRLVALVEASLWVTIGLAIARLGSGEWAYIATPLGFYAGCLSVGLVFAPQPAHMLEAGSIVFGAADWVVWPLLVYLLLRVALMVMNGIGASRAAPASGPLWSPHLATLVIGFTFLATLLLAGSWAYTDVLAELARGMAHSLLARFLLVLCLLLGALAGGWQAGRLRSVRISAHTVLRCFAGGVLMGWDSLLIPGGNDGLILIGMPLLWPYAWVAFATMCLCIAAAQLLQRRIARPRPA